MKDGMDEGMDMRAAQDAYDAAVDELLSNLAADEAIVSALTIRYLKSTGPLHRAYQRAAQFAGAEKAEALRETAAGLAPKAHFLATTVLGFLERRRHDRRTDES